MSQIISFFKDDTKRTILFLGVSAVFLVLSFLGISPFPFDAAWIAVVLCGVPIIKDAVVGLVTRFDIKADVLVSIALIAAVCIGEIFAAGEVAFIMMIGALLEELTVARARSGIERLVNLTPQTARIMRAGKEETVAAEAVKRGDTLRVLAGETVPADGVIISGQTSIDESVLTGESLPVDKEQGDEVRSGSVNQFGTFDMRVTKDGEDSSLQRMIRLVQSADADKAKIVRLADRWATWIVVIALVSATLTGIISGEIIRAVTILVVFCPCALVLATPTAIMAGIGNVTKFGALVREGDALERLANVRRILFDKTGTLTFGKPAVVDIKTYSNEYDAERLLQLAAVAERKSEHPLGKAILKHFKKSGKTGLDEPERFELLPGRGVQAVIDDTMILAGNEKLLAGNGVDIPADMQADVRAHKDNGCTAIYVTANGVAIGFIALSDTIRPDARQTVSAIQNTGIKCTLLTGDNEHAAQYIAKQTGITDVYTNCLPEDKVRILKEYQDTGEMVCMIGDGINDAPALKTALVGIAMGGIGSDIAIDAADIALIRDDIKSMPHLLALSRKMMRTIKQNIAFSLLLNFVAIGFAIAGVLSPVVGALVHNAGSVVVIINSALLLRWGVKKRKTEKNHVVVEAQFENQ